jgi:hypothetical protein
MGIPHRSAEYPRLASAVPLPERRFAAGAGAGDDRPRRRRTAADRKEPHP